MRQFKLTPLIAAAIVLSCALSTADEPATPERRQLATIDFNVISKKGSLRILGTDAATGLPVQPSKSLRITMEEISTNRPLTIHAEQGTLFTVTRSR